MSSWSYEGIKILQILVYFIMMFSGVMNYFYINNNKGMNETAAA